MIDRVLYWFASGKLKAPEWCGSKIIENKLTFTREEVFMDLLLLVFVPTVKWL